MIRVHSRTIAAAALLAATLALAACATQVPSAIDQSPSAPGFVWGLLHGFIFPFAWIGSLFSDRIAVYAVPNNGGWYDFGYFIGITVLGGGSFFGHSKTRRRRD